MIGWITFKAYCCPLMPVSQQITRCLEICQPTLMLRSSRYLLNQCALNQSVLMWCLLLHSFNVSLHSFYVYYLSFTSLISCDVFYVTHLMWCLLRHSFNFQLHSFYVYYLIHFMYFTSLNFTSLIWCLLLHSFHTHLKSFSAFLWCH